MANLNCKSVLQKMQEVVPYYLAKYVEWYFTPESDRCSWNELCGVDDSFKVKTKVNGRVAFTGDYKTEQFAKDNWLTREDVQQAMQIYAKYMKTYNTMQIYQKMLQKALEGDVNAAKYIESFHDSDFFDESTDDLNEFLNTVSIPKLKKTRMK